MLWGSNVILNIKTLINTEVMVIWFLKIVLYKKKIISTCSYTLGPSFVALVTSHSTAQLFVCRYFWNYVYVSWKCYFLQNCSVKVIDFWRNGTGADHSTCTELYIWSPKNSTVYPNPSKNVSTIKSQEHLHLAPCWSILRSTKSGGLCFLFKEVGHGYIHS